MSRKGGYKLFIVKTVIKWFPLIIDLFLALEKVNKGNVMEIEMSVVLLKCSIDLIIIKIKMFISEISEELYTFYIIIQKLKAGAIFH